MGRGFHREIIRRKLKYSGATAQIHTVAPNGEEAPRLTWVKVNHSIPDAHSLAIETPAGTIVHSGDFRPELNPTLGAPTDFPTSLDW